MTSRINKIEKITSLKIGKGVRYLLNEAYKILGNPILVHDMEYKIIAYTDNIVTDDPIWNEFTITGTVGRDRLEFYKNEKFLDTAANAKKVTFLISDKLKYDRIIGKLFNSDNIQIGLAAIEAHNPFSDDMLEIFECFCNVLNEEFSKSEYYRDYGQKYQEYLINKLINGDIEDKKDYTAHVESVYINLKKYLYLAVADTTQCDPEHIRLSYFRDLFKKTQPSYKYSIYSDYIIIIISSNNEILSVKKDLNKLNKVFGRNNIYAGISSCFENLFELKKYYTEAVRALNYGLKSKGSQRFFQYDTTEQCLLEIYCKGKPSVRRKTTQEV